MTDLSMLPKGYPYRKRGSCIPAAVILLRRIPGAIAESGHVVTPGGKLEQHTWVRKGRRIYDPTIRQFKWWRKGMKVDRLALWKYTSQEFFAQLLLEAGHKSEAADHWAQFNRWLEAA
jgi:hypothetical protein